MYRWDKHIALQNNLSIMPISANFLLAFKYFPVVC
jgi:hypothetical protein